MGVLNQQSTPPFEKKNQLKAHHHRCFSSKALHFGLEKCPQFSGPILALQSFNFQRDEKAPVFEFGKFHNSRVCIPNIRIPSQRWDDHPQY